MWEDIKQAARRAVILGIQYGIVITLILLCLVWVLGDYLAVRQYAMNGQRAYTALIEAKQHAK